MDAFRHVLMKERAYANPPFNLITRLLAMVKRQRTRLVLVHRPSRTPSEKACFVSDGVLVQPDYTKKFIVQPDEVVESRKL